MGITSDIPSNKLPHRRHIQLTLLTALISILLAVAIGEMVVRAFLPQKSLYPRWEFSSHYGSELFKNTTMVHEMPGQWRFEYTINGYGYRGSEIPVSNVYDKKNIIVLGDSNAFGTGVNDGQEFAAILAAHLDGMFDVINLGVGGWGLLQQIRKYYEFGGLYDPEVVILLFAGNDPKDNLKNRLTLVEGDKFRFVNSDNTINQLKKYLSHSWIQKSQLYNFFRDRAYRIFERAHIEKSRQLEESQSERSAVDEELYNEGLGVFARDLSRNNVMLVMIAVNGSLEKYPLISSQVAALNDEGVLKYVEVAHWFTGLSGYSSPEGHSWGVEAHRIIGNNITPIIKGIILDNNDQGYELP